MKRSKLEELSRGSRWAEEPLNPDSKSGKAFAKKIRSIPYTPKVSKTMLSGHEAISKFQRGIEKATLKKLGKGSHPVAAYAEAKALSQKEAIDAMNRKTRQSKKNTIQIGPKGGRYYITEGGTKVYV
jgi:hypothetical protein